MTLITVEEARQLWDAHCEQVYNEYEVFDPNFDDHGDAALESLVRSLLDA